MHKNNPNNISKQRSLVRSIIPPPLRTEERVVLASFFEFTHLSTIDSFSRQLRYTFLTVAYQGQPSDYHLPMILQHHFKIEFVLHFLIFYLPKKPCLGNFLKIENLRAFPPVSCRKQGVAGTLDPPFRVGAPPSRGDGFQAPTTTPFPRQHCPPVMLLSPGCDSSAGWPAHCRRFAVTSTST